MCPHSAMNVQVHMHMHSQTQSTHHTPMTCIVCLLGRLHTLTALA
jgi:hypothetical protein